jgi:Putative peptidoglycan binding domain/L,D-transpeptidase catalytic domain
MIAASLLILVAAPGSTADAAPGSPSFFTPLDVPVRLADSRNTGAFAGGASYEIAVTGGTALPTPGSISAAVLNVTVVGPASPGYWTVYPHGAALPVASNINVDAVSALQGDALALANLVTVPVGPTGTVDVYSSAGGHVVIDMLGYYSPAPAATAGRFVPLPAPSRMLDTRDTNAPLVGGEPRTFAYQPAAGSEALVLNVTTIGNGPGFFQVYPTNGDRPTTSNLNSMFAGHTTANQVIVPVTENGEFSVYSNIGGQLIVDVIGTFTGNSAASDTVGLFVPLDSPTRFLDTRAGLLNPLGGTKRLLGGWNVEVGVATNPAVNRPDVAAVVLNLTVTDTFAAGYVSVTPAGSNDPGTKARKTSNLNVTRIAQTLANHVTVPVSSRGFDVFAQSPTHAIADVAGFYLGASVPAPFGTPQNVDPTPAFCLGFTSEVIVPSQQGAAGPNIAVLQQRLLDLGFWNQGADGNYGWSTQQAVMAYQKWTGLSASGRVDATTASRLSYPNCRPVPGTNSGDLFEIDKGRQLGIFIRGGKLLWLLNVSTGGGYFYEDEINGVRYQDQAITDSGNFTIYRVVDTPRYEGTLGTMYRPRFVVGGIAVHGAPNVPNYPASHGCIRVSNPAMDMIWAQNLLPMGSRVWIHD